MSYKIINKKFYNNMTFLTLPGTIRPINAGDAINGGASRVLSSIIPGDSTPEEPQIVLVVSGNFTADEVFY